jgi:hypothetical protein
MREFLLGMLLSQVIGLNAKIRYRLTRLGIQQLTIKRAFPRFYPKCHIHLLFVPPVNILIALSKPGEIRLERC